MLQILRVVRLLFAVMLGLPTLLPPAAAAAQTPPVAPDYQRYITFHNDFDFPIYPVIQVPADLCNGGEDTSVRRILVNGAGHSSGLAPQETLTVLIPNEQREVDNKGMQELRRCWYASGRIYIFPVDIAEFEKMMVKLDSNNDSQRTKYDNSENVPCFDGKRDAQGAAGQCFTGTAANSFAADVPAQLAEFTFDSDNAAANKDPDTGTPMADIDVSYVDDVYLPVAASVANHGATGYMGSALKLDTFAQRLSGFQAKGWPVYSAYLEQYWAGNAFSTLLPPALGGAGNAPGLHLPAGYNSIENTISLAASSLYSAGGSEPNYLISGVVHMDSQVQPYIDLWMAWVDGNPCAAPDQLVWPENITSAFDKQHFCQRFQATVQTVWNHFLTDENDGFQHNQAAFYKDCGLPPDSVPDANVTNACIIQHIVGYNSGVLGGALPGEVQAILRGVAYDPQDGAQQYQFDPFLTFDAPFNSQFSLDPYTRLIHSTQDGVSAVAYSFSIDDKYGNFRDASSGFIVDAGGTTGLDNKQPFDPYQQYKLNWGYNRDTFGLILLDPNVNLASVEPQLQALASQNDNRPFLIKQAERLAVLGHASGTNWKLTDPLITQDQLRTLAQQTPAYQGVSDHTFGDSSVFPSTPLNISAPRPQDIGTLDFDSTSGWSADLLYAFISQQNADISALVNWTGASVCGVDVPVSGPGSQRLPLRFQNDAYQACSIKLTDSFGGSLALDITPVQQRSLDSYTGSTVSVWGLPIGSAFSGQPPVTNNLSDADLQSCHSGSSLADLCANVTMSATWAADPLARDVVYMGLDPKAMPRVNVNLPAAPKLPPDPKQVTWPPDAKITSQLQSDGTVLVSWPAARVGSGAKLEYLLYVKDGANWNPVGGCDQAATSCRAKLGASASMYVIAVNTSVTPPMQTPQLFGCYPSNGQCGVPT